MALLFFNLSSNSLLVLFKSTLFHSHFTSQFIYVEICLPLRKCYDEKGRGAVVSKDDDVRPWLRGFVESVGEEKAQKLLANAGSFVRLMNISMSKK